MAFFVGQKVVCVDDSSQIGHVFMPGEELQRDAIYTIAALTTSPNGTPSVRLLERPRSVVLHGYYRSRFRPVVEHKTDISIFNEILANPRKKIREPNKRQREAV